MFRKNSSKILILSILLILISFYSYTYILKDIFLNNTSQTIQIDPKSVNKLFELKKHAEQNNVYSIEFEITGTSNENIVLFIGESPFVLTHKLLLKKGKIDFVYASDWYQDNCFLKIEPSENGSAAIKIEYRFISSRNQ